MWPEDDPAFNDAAFKLSLPVDNDKATANNAGTAKDDSGEDDDNSSEETYHLQTLSKNKVCNVFNFKQTDN